MRSLSSLLWVFAIFSITSILIQQGVVTKLHSTQVELTDERSTTVGSSEHQGEGVASPNTVDTALPGYDYMIKRAGELEAEARHMEEALENDLANYKSSMQKKNEQVSSSRIPYRLHFFTYANDSMNLTKIRILRQAERSGFFVSIHALTPQHVPANFRDQFHDILSQPTGGGFYLWRFPILEHILQTIDPYDYFLFIDAGCTVLSTGREELLQWLSSLDRASTRGVFGTSRSISSRRKEIMRFPQESDDFAREIKWTTDRVFGAFNLTIEAPPEQQDKVWPLKRTGQFNGGLWLARNGPQMRYLLAFVYRILALDPYIITNKYNEETRRRRPGRFKDHRHDQSLTSITCKLLQNYILAPIMPDWKKPPFSVSRFRTITQAQLTNWTSACYHPGEDEEQQRQQDDFCDTLAMTGFEFNTQVEARRD